MKTRLRLTFCYFAHCSVVSGLWLSILERGKFGTMVYEISILQIFFEQDQNQIYIYVILMSPNTEAF